MSEDTKLRLNSGKAAAAATGLPSELFDTASLGLFFGMSQLMDCAEHRAAELQCCLASVIDEPNEVMSWFPVVLRSDQMIPLESCSPCEEACGETGGFVHEIDSNVEGFCFIQNRITGASVTESVDCQLIRTGSRKFLRFMFNPFADSEDIWAPAEVSEFGVTHKRIYLWMYKAEFTTSYVRQYLAPLSGLPPSIHPDIHAAVLDLKIAPSDFQLRRLIGLISNSPVADADGTVEDVYTPADRTRIVVVDGRVYRGNVTVNPVVEVGQRVVAGDKLFDGFEYTDLSCEELDWDNVLYVPGSLFGLTDIPSIRLSINPVAVVLESVSRITFDVGPNSAAYWDYVYGRSDELVEDTLARLRGLSSVVPFEFFKQYKLNYGGIAVRLSGWLIGDNVAVVRALRKYMPPHRTLLLSILEPIPNQLLPADTPCCVI